MRPLTALLIALALAPNAAAQTATSGADEQAVVAAAQRLFDAMQARDTTAILGLLHPDAQIVAVAPSGAVRVSPGQEWARSLAGVAEELRERIWTPRVESDGALATLWARYDFHLGDRFSHCGTDAFQFVRDPAPAQAGGSAWRLLVVTFTMEVDGCPGRSPAR